MHTTRFLIAAAVAALIAFGAAASRSDASTAPVVPPGGKSGGPVVDVAPLACPGLVGRGVPQSAISDALGSPATVYGFLMPANPAVPLGPFNPPRRSLALVNSGKRYHPLFNRLTFKLGCS